MVIARPVALLHAASIHAVIDELRWYWVLRGGAWTVRDLDWVKVRRLGPLVQRLLVLGLVAPPFCPSSLLLTFLLA